jgi:hypothetical protein
VQRRGVAGLDGMAKDAQEQPLTVELLVGVLRDQPCMVGAFFANQRPARPSNLGDNLPQAISVRDLDARMVNPVLECEASCEPAVGGPGAETR